MIGKRFERSGDTSPAKVFFSGDRQKDVLMILVKARRAAKQNEEMCAHVKWNSPDEIECAVQVCMCEWQRIHSVLLDAKQGKKAKQKTPKGPN